MPDVTELLDNVTALLDSNIKKEVGAGQQVFRDIQFAIRRSVNEHIPSVQQVIAETGQYLHAVSGIIYHNSIGIGSDFDSMLQILYAVCVLFYNITVMLICMLRIEHYFVQAELLSHINRSRI